MQTEADPYELLGVPGDATLQEVKLAYRKAALECKPERFAGDADAAEKRLRQINAAYREISRKLEPSAWSPTPPPSKTYTPQDFAREGSAAYWRPPEDQAQAGDGKAGHHTTTVVESTRNETAWFLVFWALAIILGIVFGGGAASWRAYHTKGGGLETSDIVISVVVGELIYVALAAAAVVLVILTRKIVRLTIRFAHNHWRFLPAPPAPPANELTQPVSQELTQAPGKRPPP
jgi:hypothetical protein